MHAQVIEYYYITGNLHKVVKQANQVLINLQILTGQRD